MVEDRVTDGRRIGQLLAAEVRGHERGPLGRLAVVDVHDVEGSVDGEFAYGVDVELTDVAPETAADVASETAPEATPEPAPEGAGSPEEGHRLADVYVHEDRVRVEFRLGVEVAAAAGRDADLRVRPTATRPPRTLVFVESGAAVKRATDAIAAVAEAVATGDTGSPEAGDEDPGRGA